MLLTLVSSLLLSTTPACENRNGCTPDCTGSCCDDDGCGGSCTDSCTDEGQFCNPDTCLCSGQCLDPGMGCTRDYQCCFGLCHLRGGYCAATGCAAHDECVNEGLDGYPMCCIDDGAGDSLCVKIDAGDACGDQTATCGQACGGQLDSACLPGLACISHGGGEPNPACAIPCTDNTPCSDCAHPQRPTAEFVCDHALVDEPGFCVAGGLDNCDSGDDCPEGEACIPIPVPYGHPTHLERTCTKFGDLLTGASCAEGSECVSGWCESGHCTEICENDGHCPDRGRCSLMVIEFDEDGVTVESLPVCRWVDGSLNPCATADDCLINETCWPVAPPTGGIEPICIQQPCSPVIPECALPGAPCVIDAMCQTGICLRFGQLGKFCTNLCEDNTHCTGGYTCNTQTLVDDRTTQICGP